MTTDPSPQAPASAAPSPAASPAPLPGQARPSQRRAAAWPRQALALALAEWRRLLTTPVWAILLVVWTISTALVFRVALDQAASEELPPLAQRQWRFYSCFSLK